MPTQHWSRFAAYARRGALGLALLLGLAGCGSHALAQRGQVGKIRPPALTATPTNWLPTAVPAPPCGSTLTPGARDGADLLLPAVMWPTDAATAPHAPTHYTSEACAADLARFFQTRLPADGWRLVSLDQQDAQQYAARFQRAAVTVDILITGYPDASGSYVIIQE